MALKSSSKDFEVLNKIGQGSFGTVFKVRRKVDKNFYVMKTINISQMDRRGQQESVNEVKILASLDNPYIVKYFDSFIENKTLSIIMEFCEKGDLSQAIRSQMGRLIIETKIWKYFIQMCLGLEFIHSRKILHRDIKSMNVFLVRDDMVRIGDLGVAKVLANTAAFAHTMVGTPYYLSPELCEEKPYNVKSDVWALGCVLYELCTLKHPFDALNQAALLLKIIKGNYIPISSSYSNELREVVDLCLCKDYRKRPNISNILNRPGIKDRAVGLGILIPANSVLNGAQSLMPKDPSFVYQSQMAVIEEEKVSQCKNYKSNEKVNQSPAPNRPTPNDFKREVRPEAKKEKNPVVKANVQDLRNNFRPAEKEAKKLPERDLKIVEKEPEKVSARKSEPIEAKGQHNSKDVKPKAEVHPHYNNLHFEPASNLESKEPKMKPNPIRVSPRNGLVKPEAKVEVKVDSKNEALRVAASKAVLKPAPKADSKPEPKPEPKPESKQKVIKPGLQAPYFMPPQRPSDAKAPKKEPEPVKVNDEVRQVLNLPDYPKAKKPSLQIFKPVLKKFEVKKFEILMKPLLENDPPMIDPFTETIDWNLTQTGFVNKETIPVANFVKEDFQEFRVNYAKSTNFDEENEENDDELYQVSNSDNEDYEEDPEKNENEGFEDDDETEVFQNLNEQLKKANKELNEANKLIEIRKKEIISRVGIKNFEEMYEFFKAKANSEADLNDDEQREIENFMYTKVSIENTDICITISKLFHNESEKTRLESLIESLHSRASQ